MQTGQSEWCKQATLFVHALFGGMNFGVSDGSVSGFAMGFGGGVDVNINDRFAVRTVRFGFGIVIK